MKLFKVRIFKEFCFTLILVLKSQILSTLRVSTYLYFDHPSYIKVFHRYLCCCVYLFVRGDIYTVSHKMSFRVERSEFVFTYSSHQLFTSYEGLETFPIMNERKNVFSCKLCATVFHYTLHYSILITYNTCISSDGVAL